MKKVTALFLLLVIYGLGYSQNQVGSSPIYYLNGKVGIGVDNPSSKLDVNGTIKTRFGNNHGILFEGENKWFNISSRWGYANISWFNYWDGNNWISTHNEVKASSIMASNNGIHFFLSNSLPGNGNIITDRVEKFTIRSNGNVGIGISNPGANLHVKSTSDTKIRVEGMDPRFDLYGSNTHWLMQTVDGSNNRFRIYNETTNSEKFTILANGNVGIGTSNPGIYKLDVNGKIRIPSGGNGAAYLKFDYNKLVSSSTNSRSWIVGNDLFHWGDFGIYQSVNKLDNDLSSTIHNHRFYISKDGNVGIGTTNTHGYKLAVDGKMIVEEVVVKMSENWPDFVFARDYNLKPLEEVEDFVNENKHLPGIPSEEEAKDGVGLAEMNKKLLQKVEELTLYMIEMNKENKELLKRVEKLEEK